MRRIQPQELFNGLQGSSVILFFESLCGLLQKLLDLPPTFQCKGDSLVELLGLGVLGVNLKGLLHQSLARFQIA